jgi:D-xylose transport system ATP-binding protein
MPEGRHPVTGFVPLLELQAVTKRFGAVWALQEVDLECRAGEVLAVVGDNGAGKSTLVRLVSGALSPDSGAILLDGAPVPARPAGAAALGIASVHQDLALCDNLDVVANVFLGREQARGRASRRGGLRRLDERAMERTARRTFEHLGFELPDLRSAVATLSGGQRQAVALARVAIGPARLVILDEPTAALSAERAGQILDLVRRLRDDGRGVIVVSHSMPDVFAVSDRIAVLRHGELAATFRTADVTSDDVVRAVVGGRVRVPDGRRGW